MSYDPSHRRPPRQEHWPAATPPAGWPPYRDGDEYRGGEQAAGWYEASRQHAYQRVAAGSGDYGSRAGGYPGYGTANGYGGAEADYGWTAGYASPPDEYDWDPNGYRHAAHGYATGRDDYPPQAGYPGPGRYTEYREPVSGDPRLTAPDAAVGPGTWQAGQDSRREARQRGMMVGAVTEMLGTAVVIGVSTLAAGLLRARISPVAAMGSVFIDRTPAALRHALLHHFGPHGRAVLLLGMYGAIALTALVIGVLARRAAALGVAGIAAFTLFAAFAVVTRPASHPGDVTPAVVGGIAGIAALLWLVRASAPVAPLRHTRGAARGRTR